MAFDILIDTYAIEGRVEGMIEKLKVVPVPAELTAWQREDMRRRFPYTEVINPTAARTLIYPRSRRTAGWLQTKRPPRPRKPVMRGKAKRIGRPILPASSRPILRPELFEQLRARMRDMMQREIKW